MAYKEEFIDVRGSKIQLLRGGSGDPVLYLHGAGGEVAWLPFFEHLSRDFTVYLPAHPGFGRSEGLEKIDTIEDLAFHYIDVMDALKLERPIVVGLSLGGWLAAELAIRYQHRMRKLVLIDAVGLKVDNFPIADIFAPTPPELRRLVFYQPESEAAKTFVPEAPSPDALEMILRAREATARVGWNPFLYDPKLRDRLYRITIPTMVVWGDTDRVVPIQHGDAYRQGIAGSRLVTVQKCGHLPPLERPEETARLIAEFLKS